MSDLRPANGRGQCVLQVRAGDLKSDSWTDSEPTRIRGLQWRVAALVENNVLTLKLSCTGDNVDAAGWSCLASARLRMGVAQEDYNRRDKEHTIASHVFSAKTKQVLITKEDWWQTVHLDDTITLEADINAEPPRGVIALPKLDVLNVNGQPIDVNKELLAANSTYFKTLFFNPNFKEGTDKEFKLQIADPPAGVHHFERLVALMYPQMYPEYKPIDDDYVEGVLHLANEYQIEVVEGICLEFLRTNSKKSALFKYRLAEKYGYSVLKAHVLRNMTKTDFDGANFEANVHECFALGGDNDAFQALLHRYRELYPPPKA